MLRAVRSGAFADRALARWSRRLDPSDRRLARELAYGVLRLRGRLDFVLEGRVRGGLGRVEPDVLDVLRLGLYQLLELDRVPAYAAVDEAVEAARIAAGPGAGALVNAVLRSVAREGWDGALFPDRERDPVGYLSTWGSHPRWLVERWVACWGADEAERLVEANNRTPPVCLTSLEGGAEDCLRRLAECGVSARPAPLARDSVEIDAVDLESALRAVPCVVQDPAAALVVEYADPEEDEVVADLCAAPGGKALKLAASGRTVVACDRSRSRLRRLAENLARAPALRVSRVCAAAAAPSLRPVDAVLLDVPCTGTGTFRRHPDARWRIGPADLAALAEAQRRWLGAAAGVVRPGGLLVYATCSLEAEENEDQVSEFLEERREYCLEAPPRDLPEGVITGRGELSVLPQHFGTDGAFAARLRRRGTRG